MACALCGVSLDKADPRIWDARELGLFDSLPSLRVQATHILGKHDLLDNAREPSALVPATDPKASDYGRPHRTSYEIGRESCSERGCQYVCIPEDAVSEKKTTHNTNHNPRSNTIK